MTGPPTPCCYEKENYHEAITTMGDASSLSVCRGNHRRDVDWHGIFAYLKPDVPLEFLVGSLAVSTIIIAITGLSEAR